MSEKKKKCKNCVSYRRTSDTDGGYCRAYDEDVNESSCKSCWSPYAYKTSKGDGENTKKTGGKIK